MDLDDDLVPCPACTGSGEIDTGRREWETGHYETRVCGPCQGTGELPRYLAARIEHDLPTRHEDWT